MHIIQRKILTLLNQTQGKKFSELKREFDEGEKFEYHLKELLRKNYVTRSDGTYKISPAGGYQFRNFDLVTLADVHSKLPVLILIFKYRNKYILRKRSGGFGIGLVRINAGVAITDTIEAKLVKYGIEGSYRFVKVLCMKGVNSKDELLYDNIFLIFEIQVSDFDEKDNSLKLVEESYFLNKGEHTLFEAYRDNQEIFTEKVQWF